MARPKGSTSKTSLAINEAMSSIDKEQQEQDTSEVIARLNQLILELQVGIRPQSREEILFREGLTTAMKCWDVKSPGDMERATRVAEAYVTEVLQRYP